MSVKRDRNYKRELYGILDLESIISSKKNKINLRVLMVNLNWQKKEAMSSKIDQ